jgi:hypothetical protein
VSLHIDTSRPEQMKVRFIWTGAEPEGPISVVGSFNDWQPGLDELQPDAHGNRSVVLGLPYGSRQTFRYLGPDGEWFDEPDADKVSDNGSVLLPRTFGST